MTGDDAMARLRAHLEDRPGDLDTGADWDPTSCQWTPEDLLGFWNAGWTEYCRRAPVYDATGPAAAATVPTGQSGRVRLAAPVLWVERAAVAGAVLRRVDARQLDDLYRDSPQPWESLTGTPTAYLIEPGTPPWLRLFPAPASPTEVRLAVRRGPVELLTAGNLAADLPDLDESAAQAIVWWAAGIAYGRPKTSSYAPELAATNRTLFEQAVGPGLDPGALEFRQRTAGRPPQRVRSW